MWRRLFCQQICISSNENTIKRHLHFTHTIATLRDITYLSTFNMRAKTTRNKSIGLCSSSRRELKYTKSDHVEPIQVRINDWKRATDTTSHCRIPLTACSFEWKWLNVTYNVTTGKTEQQNEKHSMIKQIPCLQQCMSLFIISIQVCSQ